MSRNLPIISPKKSKTDPAIGPACLMILLPSELRYLVCTTRARGVPLKDAALDKIYIADQDGFAPLSLCGPFLGAPQAVMAMEKLIALGARRIWMLGWCGSISAKATVGDLILPTHAFSEEGTSAHYPIDKPEITVDSDLQNTLRELAKKRGIKPLEGSVWTTDAPYRETKNKVQQFQRKGALAVDMEFSALAKVALFRSIKFASLLVVSDELFEYVWRPGFNDPRLRRQTRVAAKILLEASTAQVVD